MIRGMRVALNDLGIARDLQGRHTDAQTAYREALGVNPDMAARSGQPGTVLGNERPVAGRGSFAPAACQQA